MDGAPETLAHWRWLAGRAMAEAAGTGRGAGPVQLNLPYREPLLPDGPLGPEPGPARGAVRRARSDGVRGSRMRRSIALAARICGASSEG